MGLKNGLAHGNEDVWTVFNHNVFLTASKSCLIILFFYFLFFLKKCFNITNFVKVMIN